MPTHRPLGVTLTCLASWLIITLILAGAVWAFVIQAPQDQDSTLFAFAMGCLILGLSPVWLSLAATIALWRLRRSAPALFTAALAAHVILTLILLPIGSAPLLAGVIPLGLLSWYGWHLRSAGMLTAAPSPTSLRAPPVHAPAPTAPASQWAPVMTSDVPESVWWVSRYKVRPEGNSPLLRRREILK